MKYQNANAAATTPATPPTTPPTIAPVLLLDGEPVAEGEAGAPAGDVPDAAPVEVGVDVAAAGLVDTIFPFSRYTPRRLLQQS